MMLNDQILHLMEEFKIPYKDPYCPEDWKDWYHYILYNPETRVRFLYNLSFNGKTKTGFVTDTLFLTMPKGYIHGNIFDPSQMETYGFARNRAWDENELHPAPFHYHNNDILLSIHNNSTSMRVLNLQSGIAFKLKGKPVAEPVYVPELAPYGSGFHGWGVIPGYSMKGIIQIGEKKIEVTDQWYGYHDRNFGRFSWGNIGWTWFVVSAKDETNHEWNYVMHRTNNNSYTEKGSPILFVYCGKNLRKIFLGRTVDLQFKWEKSSRIPPILPGAMASVFSDRSILMPTELIVKAEDEKDYVLIKMKVDAATEMIVPDNEKKQYTFLKELSGIAKTAQFFDDKKTVCRNGFFYAEHVH